MTDNVFDVIVVGSGIEGSRLIADYESCQECISARTVSVRYHLQLLDHHKVINIIPGSAVIEVTTDKGTFFGTRIIITADCWTNRVLKYTELQLPLQIIKAESLYCPVNDPLLFMPNAFLVFTYYDSADSTFSGVPINEHNGLLKIIAHSGSKMDDPNYRDTVTLQTSEMVGLFVTKRFRGVEPQPTVIEPCMYSVTPDKYPVLDRHPTHRNIVIGAGFSGYGFKFAPVVGQILSELAFDIQTSHDITPFAISRFDSTDNGTE